MTCFRAENYYFPNRKCRFLILGKAGTGKSSTGNMLLGRNHFEVSGSFVGSRENCQGGSAKFFDTTIEVIDTPGIGFFPHSTEDLYYSTEDVIAKALASLDVGPNVILFTICCRVRFTQEDYQAFNIIKSLMGPQLSHYLILVFTAADGLDVTIEQNLASRPKTNPESKTCLAHLAQYAGARYVTFNNKLPYNSTARDKQIDELLTIAKKMVAVNEREHFCSTMSERITEIVNRYVAEEISKTGKSEKAVREKMKEFVE